RIWLMAARVRTLPASVAPVLVGTALAVTHDVFRAGAFIAALLGAVFIQVGTNLANDYSDARRGADTEARLGPVRVTAGGPVRPRPIGLWARTRSRCASGRRGRASSTRSWCSGRSRSRHCRGF